MNIFNTLFFREYSAEISVSSTAQQKLKMESKFILKIIIINERAANFWIYEKCAESYNDNANFDELHPEQHIL